MLDRQPPAPKLGMGYRKFLIFHSIRTHLGVCVWHSDSFSTLPQCQSSRTANNACWLPCCRAVPWERQGNVDSRGRYFVVCWITECWWGTLEQVTAVSWDPDMHASKHAHANVWVVPAFFLIAVKNIPIRQWMDDKIEPPPPNLTCNKTQLDPHLSRAVCYFPRAT